MFNSSHVLSVPSRLLVITSLGLLSLNANTLEPLSYLDFRGTVWDSVPVHVQCPLLVFSVDKRPGEQCHLHGSLLKCA